MQHRCPVCKRIIEPPPGRKLSLLKHYPFCCERCRFIDLGVWFDAGYRLSGKSDENITTGPDSPTADKNIL